LLSKPDSLETTHAKFLQFVHT